MMRKDNTNYKTVDPEELEFLDILLNEFSDKEFVFLDVGANVGHYTQYIIDNCSGSFEGHLFEPTPELYKMIVKKYSKYNIKINNLAVDNKINKRTFTVSGANVCSSLSGRVRGRKIEVDTTTIPHYVETNDIQHIDLLKIDTEGHEKIILDSCIPLFNDNKFSVIQFEYGGTWTGPGWFGGTIYEVFDILTSHGFSMYSNRYQEGILPTDKDTFINDYHSEDLIAIHDNFSIKSNLS